MFSRSMLIATLALAGHASAGNLVINGSFEQNAADGTEFNLANDDFNALVSNAHAFGASNEIDLVTGDDYGAAPIAGDWKVGLHQRLDLDGAFDAIALNLSQPLVIGQEYFLEALIVGDAVFGGFLGDAEFGVSMAQDDFGTLVHAQAPTSVDTWDAVGASFVAQSEALYLTVRNSAVFNTFVFVDDISLQLVPAPATIALVILAAIGSGRRR